MKSTLLIVSLLSISFCGYSQCAEPIIIADSTINKLSSPYQQTFLNSPPANRLDSLVAQLLTLKDYTDMGFAEKIIDEIGKIQSPNAYALLYNACCRPLIIKDINAFNSFAGVVTYYNGYEILNKYYLNNRVNSVPDKQIFVNRVTEECRKKEPVSFYCELTNAAEPEINKELSFFSEKSHTLKVSKKDTTIERRDYHWMEHYEGFETPVGFGEVYNGTKNGMWLQFNKTTYTKKVLYTYRNDTICGRAIEWNYINDPHIIEMRGLLINNLRIGKWDNYTYHMRWKKRRKKASMFYNNRGEKEATCFYYKSGKIKSIIYHGFNEDLWHSTYKRNGKLLIDKVGSPDTILLEDKKNFFGN